MILLFIEPTLNVGLVNLILQEKHEVDLDMSGDTCVNSDKNVVFRGYIVQAHQLCFSDEVRSENTKGYNHS